MKRLLIAAASLAALTASASAADMAARPMYAKAAPPVVAPIYNWTGFYIGGNVGYGWGMEDVALGPTNNAASAAFFASTFPASIPNSVRPNAKGVIGGGQIGYNWQTGGFVLGLEADAQGADVKGTFNTSVGAGPIVSSTTQRMEWFGTVRGRAGFTATDSLLLYVTGGLAYGQVFHGFVANNNAGSVNTTAARTTRAGWTAGAGLEWAFTRNWSMKAEYLYIDLGTQTFATVGAGTTPAGASIDSTFRDRFHVGRLGINYRF